MEWVSKSIFYKAWLHLHNINSQNSRYWSSHNLRLDHKVLLHPVFFEDITTERADTPPIFWVANRWMLIGILPRRLSNCLYSKAIHGHFLREVFGNRIIGSSLQSMHLPSLTLCFFLWWTIKLEVYRSNPHRTDGKYLKWRRSYVNVIYRGIRNMYWTVESFSSICYNLGKWYFCVYTVGLSFSLAVQISAGPSFWESVRLFQLRGSVICSCTCNNLAIHTLTLFIL